MPNGTDEKVTKPVDAFDGNGEVDLSKDLDFSKLEEAAEEAAASTEKEAPKKKVSKKTDAEIEADREFKEKQKQAFDAIRLALDKSTSAEMLPPKQVIRNNQNFGRLIGYITNTNDAVKLSLKNNFILDANNKKILVDEATEEDRKAYADGKAVQSSKFKKNKAFAFTHAKAGEPKAYIIGTPVGTDIALIECGSSRDIRYDDSKRDLQFHVMPKEEALAYVGYNYGGKIREDKEISDDARWVQVMIVMRYDKKDGTQKTRKFFKVEAVKGANNSLAREGNYIPIKVYDAIDPTKAVGEQLTKLNYNVSAALKRRKPNDTLEQSSEKAFTLNGEDNGFGIKESDWFNKNKAIEVVDHNTGANMTRVLIPLRSKYDNNKDKDKGPNYKFDFFNMENKLHGPLSLPTTKKILARCGWTEDEFVGIISKLTHTKSSKSTKSVINTLDMEQYLKGIFGKNDLVNPDKVTLDSLQESIDIINQQ